jgi:cysteine desulfuration protein SufE
MGEVTIPLMNCQMKQAQLEEKFAKILEPKERYELIIEMGRELKKTSKQEIASPENLVSGCQSEVYLTSRLIDGKIFFDIYSEALISAGLAALLLFIYQGESPETLLTCPPTCLERMGIHASLSPGRSNGLSSMHLKMKQEALKHYLGKSKLGKSKIG